VVSLSVWYIEGDAWKEGRDWSTPGAMYIYEPCATTVENANRRRASHPSQVNV